MYVIWHVLDISSCTVCMEFPSQYSALHMHWTHRYVYMHGIMHAQYIKILACNIAT